MADAIIGKASVKIIPDTSGFRREADREVSRQLAGSSGDDGKIKVLPELSEFSRRMKAATQKVKQDTKRELSGIKIPGPDFQFKKGELQGKVKKAVGNIKPPTVKFKLGDVGVNGANSFDKLGASVRAAEKAIGPFRNSAAQLEDSVNDVAKKVNVATNSVRQWRQQVAQYSTLTRKAVKPVAQSVGDMSRGFNKVNKNLTRVQKLTNALGRSFIGPSVALAQMAQTSGRLGGVMRRASSGIAKFGFEVARTGKPLGRLGYFATRGRRGMMKFLKVGLRSAGTYGRVALGLINIRGAFAKLGRSAGRAAADMSGFNALKGVFRITKNLAASLSTMSLKIGPTVVLMGFLKIAIISLVGSIFSLGKAFASIIVGGLVAGPGIFASLAIATKIWGRAMQDAGTQLAGIKSQFDSLGEAVSGNFWAEAKRPIEEMANKLMPEIEVGSKKVATELGSFAGALAEAFGGPLVGKMDRLFDPLIESIGILKPLLADVGQGFADLVTVGASNLPRLSAYVGQVAAEFGKFLAKSAEDGSLQRWIDEGAARFRDLASVIKSVAMIFGDISEAAERASGSTLENMANRLRTIRDITNSPEFQDGLTRTFKAANDAMSDIAAKSGPQLTKFFSNMPTMMEQIAPRIAGIIGTLVDELFGILNNPIVGAGFVAMLDGFQGALDALKPGIEAVTPALGGFFAAIGRVAENLAPVVSGALGLVGVLVPFLLPVLEAVSKALSGALASLLDILVPDVEGKFESIVGAGQSLLAVLQPVIDLFNLLVGIVRDILIGVFEGFASTLGFLAPLWEMLKTAAGELGEAFKQLGEALGITGDGFNVVKFVGRILGVILGWVAGVILGVLIAAFRILTTTIKTVAFFVAWLTGKWKLAWNIVVSSFRGVVNWIKGGIHTILEWLSRVIPGADKIIGAFRNLKAQGKLSFSGLTSAIRYAVSNWKSILKNAGRAMIRGLVGAINRGKGMVKGALNRLTNLIPRWKGPINKDAKLLVPAGQAIMGGLIKSIEGQRGALRSKLTAVTADISRIPRGLAKSAALIGGNVMSKVSNAVDVTEGLEVQQFVVNYNGPTRAPDPEGGFKALAGRVATFF